MILRPNGLAPPNLLGSPGSKTSRVPYRSRKRKRRFRTMRSRGSCRRTLISSLRILRSALTQRN